MSGRYVVLEARGVIIEQVALAARRIVLDPDPGKDMGKVLDALEGMLEGYLSAVHALHTSSHVMYAERDLPEEEQTALTDARHFLRMLRAFHGPREASASV